MVGVIIDKFEFDGSHFFLENEDLIEFKPGNFSSAPIIEIETFEEFEALFNKTYDSETEREEAKQKFQENHKQIEKHNKLHAAGKEQFKNNMGHFRIFIMMILLRITWG